MKLNTLGKVITYFQLNNRRGRGQLADAVRREKDTFSDEIETGMETQWGRNIQDSFSLEVSWIQLQMIPQDSEGSNWKNTLWPKRFKDSETC